MPDAHEPDLQGQGRETPAPGQPFQRSGLARPAMPSGERPEAAVCEAVFRYQLQQLLVDAPQPLHYYIAQQGRDPDDALLGRLRALVSAVQPLSQCRVTARAGVIDRATGARGVILQVARLAWVHAAAVDVVGGYYLTHRHAAGLRYRVEQDGSDWAVTTACLLWWV
jgi:hypothetical protein